MWSTESSFSILFVGKLKRASLIAGNDATASSALVDIPTKSKINSVDKKGKLLWIDTQVNGEKLSCMLDCGATHNCLAMRCVLASKYLRNVKRSEYKDHPLVGANTIPKLFQYPNDVCQLPIPTAS